MRLKEDTKTLRILFEDGGSTELLMDAEDASTAMIGLSFKMLEHIKHDVMKLEGYITTPLIEKRSIAFKPSEVICIEMTNTTNIEFCVPMEE